LCSTRPLSVIGETANAASRIESATKDYGVSILVSDAVVAQES
jgi:class 3 adenylate cyclase